ncbi:phosphatidylethanolamine N-methyltransferase /phosphatidyl-N-methylethanolamine N-methyltransferase /demethylmenaquinone methyltransferase [Fodinibius roseus]|uniref:Phosphatidylethanolamine N-methyltransferase /phosphatidyl-N-methylethanolamine N-methyltransferase /demethylmenaquinone methyltransferase n=1 Tax=Fodinibius roseus TaxID=1194090 RepID=A0A1M5J8I2_9BACT|nr:class I SAM-dependent methyltransferase [Fodinibius roseus]SHG36323.1 phosphatidylethanolamine N-methyltransferase /phosphatidyl-N-methylethanolamine N-methyltransferase /demethylmenaquinone methyltransferase [Fodinibius roseus]
MVEHNRQHTGHTKKRYNATSVVYNIMEWPVEQLWYKTWRKMLWKKVNGPQVLEIGVGTGKNIRWYPDDIEVTGVDLSSGMLKRAKKLLAEAKNNHVTLQEMDAQQMEFPDDTYDEVVATFAFCSVPDPVLGLKEALRVTKPRGKLYLLEHMRADHPALASVMDKLDTPIHYISGVHIARKTVENVEKAGWEILKKEELTFLQGPCPITKQLPLLVP